MAATLLFARPLPAAGQAPARMPIRTPEEDRRPSGYVSTGYSAWRYTSTDPWNACNVRDTVYSRFQKIVNAGARQGGIVTRLRVRKISGENSSKASSQTARATLALREMLVKGQFRPGERIREVP